MKWIIQTVSMSDDTEARLTLKLNDWLKQWPEDKILNIQFIHRPNLVRGMYLAFVTYRK